MEKVRIAVAGAGLIGLRHIEEIGKSRGAALSRDRRRLAQGGRGGAEGRRGALPFALRAVRARIVRTASFSRHRTSFMSSKASSAWRPGFRRSSKSRSRTASPRVSACAGAAEKANVKLLVGHHRRHSPVLHKAVEIVKSGILGRLVGVMGSAVFYKPEREAATMGRTPGVEARRRPDPDQHDPRDRQPARDDRRDRRSAGVRVERDARLRGRGHGGGQPALRQWRAGHLPAVRHRARRPRAGSRPSQENKAYPTYADEDAYTIIGASGSLGVPTMRPEVLRAERGPVLV